MKCCPCSYLFSLLSIQATYYQLFLPYWYCLSLLKSLLFLQLCLPIDYYDYNATDVFFLSNYSIEICLNWEKVCFFLCWISSYFSSHWRNFTFLSKGKKHITPIAKLHAIFISTISLRSLHFNSSFLSVFEISKVNHSLFYAFQESFSLLSFSHFLKIF